MCYTVGVTQLYISWFLKVCIFTFGKNAGFIFAYLGNQYENCVAAIDAMRFSCAAPAAHFLFLSLNSKINSLITLNLKVKTYEKSSIFRINSTGYNFVTKSTENDNGNTIYYRTYCSKCGEIKSELETIRGSKTITIAQLIQRIINILFDRFKNTRVIFK